MSQVVPLSSTSLEHQRQHEAMLRKLEAQKIAATLVVPTLPEDVRQALRSNGEPVRLFGENLADVRQRLRMVLALQQVEGTDQSPEIDLEEEYEEEEVTKYTMADAKLVEARQALSEFSLNRASVRLEREEKRRALAAKRKRKEDAKRSELDELDDAALLLQKRRWILEGSQYGDSRSLSCIRVQSLGDLPLVVTGSWAGGLQLWDGRSSGLDAIGAAAQCHEDRIMGLDVMSHDGQSAMISTTSIDMTAKLWKVSQTDAQMDGSGGGVSYQIEETAHLKGHQARLCRTAFHPMKRHVGTTSFDYSWRLWDIETGQELLLQDGHFKECFGIGFHPDGSLCSTTDYASVVQLWDLRTGKSIHHFFGHVKRIHNATFHPNGFHLATAGDDGTIKIWDLRRRKLAASLPAHSNVITQVRFDPTGEYMVSSSFDGTAKAWNCRDWKLIGSMQGHDGKISGIDIIEGSSSLVTCGFDKTLKMWR